MAWENVQVGDLLCKKLVPTTSVEAIVILLHGYAMTAEDLAPLAEAMCLPAALYLPQGLLRAAPRGRSWWPLDEERRSIQLALGARDLLHEYPPSRHNARAALLELIATVRAHHPGVGLYLAGFSQGGMLACDTLLLEDLSISGMILLSSSRLAWREWEPQLYKLRGMPILIAHGMTDRDLSFAAGEGLRDGLQGGGADVTWAAFEGGHEIPFIVWRQFKRFVSRGLAGSAGRDGR
jgi:phospholipase/carboxylesterase